ncbi:hypothetical protein CJF42_04740 [Pseudoalteromonas sp. NBT06-2]|uniref:hypothetical protein n=1 Tax=Pseudoalteromonas sp. NBT06-2 TaxID=2025950 RepID=UPI000BA5F3E8|nr:hypothetical protein [Pseudoalteromonas sp. NBT06-2]PAJ75449.1 hypothetical protein CJF42_04740 [Pseudoalteromonas sp. NBT06-2]
MYCILDKFKRFSLKLILMGMVILNGCEYMPHNAKFDLDNKQLKRLIQQAKQADKAILNAFENHDLVAVGDYHWNEAFLVYLTDLVRSDSFSEKVQHIIVEFGNAKHQSVLNRYLLGEDVSNSEVELIWRDSLYFTAWMPEVYKNFFAQIRLKNIMLPEHKKIKVTLAETSFDWYSDTVSQQWQQAAKTKVNGFYSVAEQAIKSGNKSLMIFGAFHLLRVPEPELNQFDDSLLPFAARLEKHYPDRTYLVWPTADPEMISALKSIKGPALLETKTTNLKDLRMIDLLPKSRFRLAKLDIRQAKTSQLFDAFLYVGETQRNTQFPHSVITDEKWVNEMKRRASLVGGRVESKFNEILENSLKHII